MQETRNHLRPQAPKLSPAATAPATQYSGVLVMCKQANAHVLLNPSKLGRTSPRDPVVHKDLVRRFKMKEGSWVSAQILTESPQARPKVHFVDSIDGVKPEQRKNCPSFEHLTSIAPNQQLKLELPDGRMTNRVVDLFCPIGKGQRGLIVAPPRTGKTTLLQDIACGILHNHPECHLMVLLVDERPEEVTDFQRGVPAEIFASSNDEPLAHHIRIAELAVQHAKYLVEAGKHVVLMMDSLTRLARAYNNARSGSGRTMTGGLDSRALEKPRQLFSAARNTEEGGSLTIIASALIETGSRMDDLIFQEFKGTGNMEMVLDRKMAEMRYFPAINLSASGTRREELLLEPEVLKKVQLLRRAILGSKGEEATENLLARMAKAPNNEEFLRMIKAG